MQNSTMTQKGQVTIPKEIRNLLHLKPGDKVEFVSQNNNEVKIIKKKQSIDESFGVLSVNKTVSLKQIEDAIRKGPLDDFN